MEYRPLGTLGFDVSVLIYGAASLGEVDQDTADRSIQQAWTPASTTSTRPPDTASPSCGSAPGCRRSRDRIFLATKTGDRNAEAAWASIKPVPRAAAD